MATSRRGGGGKGRRGRGAGFARPTPPAGRHGARGADLEPDDPGLLQENLELLGGILLKAPPELLIELLMPTLLVNIVAGSPANGCIGASHVLRHAFGQFGIRSHLQLVDLVIRDHASGDGIMYGTPEPSWDEAGQVFDGHCVLWLPGSQRIIDATVEQFPMVRQLGMGPVIGRVAVSTVDVDLEIPPPGTHLGVQRGDLMLLYTTVPADFADVVDVPWVRDRAEQDRRSGINLASTALDALREPRVRARAVAAPYPRLRALLRAVGDADSITDEDGDVQFTVLGPNGAQRLRLDEIPLPPNTPPDPTVAGQT